MSKSTDNVSLLVSKLATYVVFLWIKYCVFGVILNVALSLLALTPISDIHINLFQIAISSTFGTLVLVVFSAIGAWMDMFYNIWSRPIGYIFTVISIVIFIVVFILLK